MGSVFATVSRKANRPFYLERICTRIYSGEELLYVLGENPELLSKDIFTVELINWLEDECGATVLSDAIKKLLASKADIVQIVNALLSLAPFISYDEKEKILKVMREGEGSSEFDKRKARGDFFIAKERYAYAIREYEALLSLVQDEESERVAGIYHNMGVAKARMFQFEQAANDFLRAYDCDENPAHYYAYIATQRFCLTDTEYIKMIGNDSSMSDVTLQLEADLENARQGFKESAEYLDFKEKKEESADNGRTAFCSYLDTRISDKKDEYLKFVM